MSENKEDFALHCLVKNEEARKRLGIKAGFFWTTAKKLSVAISRCIAAMDDKGYDEDDFKKPVRVNLPAIGDLPPEGVFDTEFCNRYEKGGEDGKTMMLIPGAVPADQFHEQMATDDDASSDTASTDTPADSDNTASDPLPAYAYNVNGELMADIEKEMSQPVSGLDLPLRYLAQCGTELAQHQITPERLRELHSLEMDPDSRTGSILLALQNRKAQLEKLDTKNLHSLASYIGKVFPKDKQPQLNDLINFIDAVFNTDYVDRGLLVKEWLKGNRVSCIQRTDTGTNAGGGIPTDRNPDLVHTLDTLDEEAACFLQPYDFNIYNIPVGVHRRAKSMIAGKESPWKEWSAVFRKTAGILDFSRGTIFAVIHNAPSGIHENPVKLLEYVNKNLVEIDFIPDDGSATDEERMEVVRRYLNPVKAENDEEKPQPTVELADESATPEAVEPDATESHPNPQPLDAESSVKSDKTAREQFSEQLAAARGDFVPGISDPDDPKWVRYNYSANASNEGEKSENPLPPTDAVTATAMEGEFIPTQEWPEYFEPGRYEGVPNDIYHAANGISSTMVKDARVSLMYYEGRHVSKTIKKERSKVLDMGNLVHVLALQPEILDTEFSVEPEIPEGSLTTTATIRAVIDEYNASLTPQLSADEIKALLEEYNSSLLQPVPLGDDVAQTGENYMSIPPEFQRVEEGQKVTAAKMKACIKEYNATLPAQMKTSGSRDALLEQLAIINPDLVAQEAQIPQPLKVSGTKADLIQAVKSVKPDTVFADELLDAWRENPGDKILVTRQQYETALAIQSALYAHPEAGKLLQNPTRAVEVSYFGIDDDTGLEIRVRPDVELEYEGLRIGFDLKTISMWDVKEDVLKSRLHREITMRDYHLSAGMYCNVADLDKFAWIFVNKDEGYHWVAVVWASDSLLELGKLEYRRTIRAIANAMDTGEWPAPVTADYTDELNDYDLRRLEALREMA
ncbi:TPA: PD-(D/E)XK nuclease-like domain-containing protein [Salmonella enterica subsp. enterica serovar Muenchen]|nr:PD-(D/E)XK nuclease-like domain-containing protein [Salmonella enterica subsp. enterica serovar Muenchen]HEC7516213.1 PD-(D/E)XK nuclease-like domain-containing protein [Salmonella enterica subsp. enterica serovar Muenchen]HEC7580245.1 PD-(D/E)XK nuclease-like domain-containing protein [Salmonella enterica subsp. enterica serovar Muenchen]HEC8713982.1 PD-(D/E)XK nuclease-like domain-containing protein [Salmonella enterica subsp. enterica serovar Muenchen]